MCRIYWLKLISGSKQPQKPLKEQDFELRTDAARLGTGGLPLMESLGPCHAAALSRWPDLDSGLAALSPPRPSRPRPGGVQGWAVAPTPSAPPAAAPPPPAPAASGAPVPAASSGRPSPKPKGITAWRCPNPSPGRAGGAPAARAWSGCGWTRWRLETWRRKSAAPHAGAAPAYRHVARARASVTIGHVESRQIQHPSTKVKRYRKGHL